MERLSGATELTSDGATVRLYVPDEPGAVQSVLRVLDGTGVAITSLSFAEASLDDVFLAATGRSLRDAANANSAAPGRNHR